MSLSSANTSCQREDIAAYLDGELPADALQQFEAHVERCSECARELRAQRQLLCTLEAAFSNSARISLPKDFTLVVAAHAASDLRGLRDKSERRRALKLSAVIGIAAFALLGAAANALIFRPANSALHILARVFDLFWQTAAEATEGVAIIGRMIARAAVTNPYGFGAFAALVFIIAISLLPRLIANYHRTEFIE